MQIKSLGQYIGAECTDFDIRGATAADIERLKQELAEHGVIAIRGQQVDAHQLAKFGEMFGELEFSIREKFRLDEQPEVYVISNIVENGKPIGNPYDGFDWHTDMCYMERPTAYTFLYGIEVPAEGANTMFASAAKGFESLPEAERERLLGMSGVHSHDRLQAQRKWDDPLKPEEASRVPDVVHPMVRTHPINGRKSVYFSIRSCFPVGVSDEDRLPFLRNLADVCTQPEFVYSHQWRVGDLVVWDNRNLLHRATEYDRQKYRRYMHRVSVIGERPF